MVVIKCLFVTMKVNLVQSILTHLLPMYFFSTPYKHQKTVKFSDVFRGQRKGALGIVHFTNLQKLSRKLSLMVFSNSGVQQVSFVGIHQLRLLLHTNGKYRFKYIKICDSWKCLFGEMSFRELSIGEISIRGIVCSGNCPS